MHKNKCRVTLSILCIPVCDQNVYLHVWTYVSAGYEELSPEEEITLHHFIFSKEKVSCEGLWGNRIMTRFVLNHSLPLAFYESLASKGTRPFYSRRDDEQIFFIVEINFWWDGRDQSCKVAVYPPASSTQFQLFLLLMESDFWFFHDWELRGPLCLCHLGRNRPKRMER